MLSASNKQRIQQAALRNLTTADLVFFKKQAELYRKKFLRYPYAAKRAENSIKVLEEEIIKRAQSNY